MLQDSLCWQRGDRWDISVCHIGLYTLCAFLHQIKLLNTSSIYKKNARQPAIIKPLSPACHSDDLALSPRILWENNLGSWSHASNTPATPLKTFLWPRIRFSLKILWYDMFMWRIIRQINVNPRRNKTQNESCDSETPDVRLMVRWWMSCSHTQGDVINMCLSASVMPVFLVGDFVVFYAR